MSEVASDQRIRAALTTPSDSPPPPRRAITLLCCCIAAAIYEADALIVAAVAEEFAHDFRLSLSGVGSLMMVRAIIQAMLMPVWGYFSDRYSRRILLSVGALLWSVDALLLSGCQQRWQLLLVRGAAGVGLSAIPPVAHSIVADLYAPEARGNAFGWIGFGTIFGGCIGTLLGVNVGDREEVMGIRGWRMVYIVMAVIGVLLAAVIFFLAVDPERGAMEPGYDPKKRLSEEARRERAKQWTLWHSMQELFAIKTFVMLFIRSAFDGIPTNANSLLILWFKYIGYTDSQSSWLVATMYSCGAISSLGGGIFADSLMRRARAKLQGALDDYAHAQQALMDARRQHVSAMAQGGEAIREYRALRVAEEAMETAEQRKAEAMSRVSQTRIMFAEIGVLLVMVFALLFFKGGPKPEYMGGDSSLSSAFAWFLIAGIFMNLVGNWDEQACDLPLTANVVPPEYRGTAFGTITMVQTLCAFLATLMVGFTAEEMFHFKSELAEEPVSTWQHADRRHNVSALGNAILAINLLSYISSLVAYLVMQNTYPSDRANLQRLLRERALEDLQAESETKGLLQQDTEHGP